MEGRDEEMDVWEYPDGYPICPRCGCEMTVPPIFLSYCYFCGQKIGEIKRGDSE